MVNQSGFVVRKSGVRENSFYIDYSGAYKVEDIAKITEVKPEDIVKIYVECGAVYDDTQDVYYFGSAESAKKAVAQVFSRVRPGLRGRVINLTEAEIEYIRKALINEVSNTIHVKNKIKDEIFKKLNG